MDQSLSFEPTITVCTAANLDANPRPHPYLNLDEQRARAAQERRNRHEKWCQSFQEQGKFDHSSSRARAQILVDEAYRQERIHLQHQLAAAKLHLHTVKANKSIGAFDKTPSPTKKKRSTGALSPIINEQSPMRYRDSGCSTSCTSPTRRLPRCACVHAPKHRQLTPKFRVMALIRERFGNDGLEEAVESMRQTYSTDEEMLQDIVYRYGPEEEEDIDPELVLANCEEKIRDLDAKWADIGASVKIEMKEYDAFQTVIRNLSIMRIFLEGSQAPSYGCDLGARARRDAFHQNVLDRLNEQGELFLTPRRVR